jgi:hypothetical protein
MCVTQPHYGEGGSFAFEFFFVLAQLRDMLTAENSTVVAEKSHHRRPFRPQRTQLYRVAVDIRQRHAR